MRKRRFWRACWHSYATSPRLPYFPLASGSLWYRSWAGGGVLFKAWPLLEGLFTRESAINLVLPFALVEVLATPMIVPGVLLIWLSRQAIKRDDAAQADGPNAKMDTLPSDM